jgi:hypothetical protein
MGGCWVGGEQQQEVDVEQRTAALLSKAQPEIDETTCQLRIDNDMS